MGTRSATRRAGSSGTSATASATASAAAVGVRPRLRRSARPLLAGVACAAALPVCLGALGR